MTGDQSPLFRNKAYDEASVFTAENLLREGRRQRRLEPLDVPDICLLDPDGDVVRHLRARGQADRHPGWACYHSELWSTDLNGRELGIVPCAVGGPYAVLVAEQLASSGCSLVISVTSAGSIIPLGEPPYFVLIEKAWRDEGTSQHYLPPAEWASIPESVLALLGEPFVDLGEPIHRGKSWTTDAPYRETTTAITAASAIGVHAVEMEAASLYSYAEALGREVVCVAHVTNSMAVAGNDFEKGDDDGTDRILELVAALTQRLRPEGDVSYNETRS